MTGPTEEQPGEAAPQGDDTPSISGSAGGAGKAYAHTLSLRLTSDGYRRLRRHVARVEDQTGQRVTHQSVIETALAEYLARNGG